MPVYPTSQILQHRRESSVVRVILKAADFFHYRECKNEPSLRSKRFRRVWEQNGVFGILPARKMGREPKKERWGRGGEGRNRLRTNPWILKTSVRWRTGLVIGWASQTFLTCVDQRSKRRGRHFLFEACLQKALTFLAEWVFSRELWQYGRIL